MKRSLFVAVLGTLMSLGLVSAGIAQTSESSSSAQSQQQATPGDEKSSASSSSQAPPAPGASSSTTTTVETKPGMRGDSAGSDVAASPRTTSESRRIFGLDPTAAVLVAAAILVVVVLALVAMTRGGSDTTSHTDIDINRRL